VDAKISTTGVNRRRRTLKKYHGITRVMITASSYMLPSKKFITKGRYPVGVCSVGLIFASAAVEKGCWAIFCFCRSSAPQQHAHVAQPFEQCPGRGRRTGAGPLAEALRFNTTITSLDLCGNALPEGGGRALAEALRLNTTITSLNLGNHGMREEVRSVLCQASGDRGWSLGV
jgi:hypothetical protein